MCRESRVRAHARFSNPIGPLSAYNVPKGADGHVKDHGAFTQGPTASVAPWDLAASIQAGPPPPLGRPSLHESGEPAVSAAALATRIVLIETMPPGRLIMRRRTELSSRNAGTALPLRRASSLRS